VVLETKTFGGTIEGQLDSPVWTQHTAGGVELSELANPVLQNQAHVWALEGFLGDLRVPICGYIVSAGRAQFAQESRTRSFPFEIYDGCCRFPLPSLTRAFSMRRGGGSSARR
jgi:hypothetical protein